MTNAERASHKSAGDDVMKGARFMTLNSSAVTSLGVFLFASFLIKLTTFHVERAIYCPANIEFFRLIEVKKDN